MKVDKNAQLVAQFVSKIKNLTRIAELADAFVDIAESEAWREYTFATGHFRFRPAEFDYFLIATGVRKDDAARVLAWNKRSKALQPLMDDSADRSKRRPFEQAAREYQAADSLNTDLVANSVELGWTGGKFSDLDSIPKGVSVPVKSPLSAHARGADQRKTWRVSWADERSSAEAIVGKLLDDDPELAHEVWKLLQANQMRITRAEKKRRSAS